MAHSKSCKERLILASGSQTRAKILRDAGLIFEIDPAVIDEQQVRRTLQSEGSDVDTAASFLAELKAIQVSNRWPSDLVIGADQILVCEEDWYDKPGTIQRLRSDLKILRGKLHNQVSAVCVARCGSPIFQYREVTKLTMRDFSESFLDKYIDEIGEAALTATGGYHFEGMGVQLFNKIDGDYFTILGLPLLPLLVFLRDYGVLSK